MIQINFKVSSGLSLKRGVCLLNIGSIVRIEDDNEWKGLYGIVKYANEDQSYIFCIQKPCYLYKATEKNNIVVM